MTTAPATNAPHSTPNHKRPSKMASSQSLNHLLNFSLPPRQSHQYQNSPRRRKQGASHAVWNKERFVHAQYRFVMDPKGDYTVHFADPDIYFQWQDILQILVPRTSALSIASNFGEQSAMEDAVMSCPICLSPPAAPRMTKCGHIFCYPCILHYFSTSDNTKWARCPVCLDTVNEKQLKAVKWIDNLQAQSEEDDKAPTASSSSASADTASGSTPAPGTALRMRLIQRPMITTLALPRSPTWPSDLLPPHQAPFYFLPDVYTFSKFMIATPTALIADLTHDLDELATERRMLASMHDDLGVSFVDAADAKVRLQMAKVSALENPTLKESIESTQSSLQELLDRAALHDRKVKEDQVRHASVSDVPKEFLAIQASGFGSAPTVAMSTFAPEPQGQVPPRGPKQRRNVNPPPSTSSYYFYQAASGMPIFLHPLDIKILLVYFGSYSAFPDTLTVRVESASESTVNDEMRKRFKYLAHLPEGQDVVFVETDPKGIVGQHSLKSFERALATRRSRREQRGKKDDKARARAEEREKERIVQNWNELTRDRVDAYIPLPPRASSPVETDNVPEQGQEAPAPAPQMAGAWGARSFASAAQQRASAAAAPPVARPPRLASVGGNVEDEWELDAAFHELEQRAGRGGSRRRNNRMVVLGGGGGRRR